MYLRIKRLFDILSSLAVLIFLSPFLLPLIFILKFTGEGDVFYLQKRIGKGYNSFDMYKFATMLRNSSNMALGTTTIVDDPRVTRVGKILRRYKINELPQLINVFIGDISVVGPRPLPENEFSMYDSEIKAVISTIRPGITGIASLIFRDEEGIICRNNPKDPKKYYETVILPYKGSLEAWYINNLSFMTDLKILFLTFYTIVFTSSNPAFVYFKNLPDIPENLKLV